MEKRNKRNKIAESTYEKIADKVLTVLIIVEMIGIVVSIASYVVPYSEATAVLCVQLHKCSIVSAWIVGVFLAVFAFCK